MKDEAKYKILLKQFLKFKSISTDISHKKDIELTALWLKELFEKNAFKVSIWSSKSANPVVFAEHSLTLSADHRSPTTVLIYGHYDVQPARKEDGWKSDPFSLSEDGKRLYGRGVIDNKGQVLVHISTIIELIKDKNLNCNVKFMIEGNEETGNPSLKGIMQKHKKYLKCDYVLISDGELTNNKPSVEVSLRGGFNAKLIYRTAKMNLHSGIWGGAVPNAAYELCKLLSKFYDLDNSVAIKNFYKGLDKPDKDELENNKRLEKESSDLKGLAGVNKMLIQNGFDFYTATGLRPTIQITGIKTGYIESGYSNIVPAEAEARLNVRIAPSQRSNDIMDALNKFIKVNTPGYVKCKLIFDNPHEPVKISSDNKYLIAIEKKLENIYGVKVNRRNVGGAIPFVADIKQILGVDAVSIPLVNEDCNMHGANENFEKTFLKKALAFSHHLFAK
jgi:acetylornithine deacetylase/succinyl-diaminopimelate desuccinylase-like protein